MTTRDVQPTQGSRRISLRERKALLGMVVRAYVIGNRALDNWRIWTVGPDVTEERRLLNVACMAVQNLEATGCNDSMYLWVVFRALARVLICLDSPSLEWDPDVVRQADDDFDFVSVAMDAIKVVQARRRVPAIRTDPP